jgi:hypothetical protein
MIDPEQLLRYVIMPVLTGLDLYSDAAARLLLGTACQESECGRWLRQFGNGPARGIFQMEPATHNDLWDNFLKYKPDLEKRVYVWTSNKEPARAEEMTGNLYYAAAMCRVHYLRFPEPIPDNLPAQAAYWKKYYNTTAGKGKVEEYISNWRRFMPSAAFEESQNNV